MNKKKMLLIGISVGIATLIIVITLLLSCNTKEKYISISSTAKMLTLLEIDKDQITYSDKYFNGADDWYVKYISYMYEKGYFDVQKIKPDSKIISKPLTYGELKKYLTLKNISYADIKTSTSIDLLKCRDGKKISKKDFYDIYGFLVAVSDDETGVYEGEISLVGTPSNIENAEKWQAFTTNGIYGFEGLVLDGYIDTKFVAYIRKNEIVAVKTRITDNITYKNAWIERGTGTEVIAYIGSGKRVFSTNKLEKDFSCAMGDICMKDGKIKQIILKQDTIHGKVLMISQDKVEIEGYGIINLSNDFKVYKTYGAVSCLNFSDIMVGYDITDFVVAGEEICGALISRNLTADNIRVLLMSTNYTSLFHERVSLTSDGDFLVKYGDFSEKHEAGDVVDIYKDSEYLKYGRVRIETLDNTDRIKVLSIERACKNPQYRGSIEAALYDQGIALVNDVLLEEYLYAVVPSEMPNRFGVEALKVQAVCARSYAYKQLLNNTYSMYGAHVDDSVNFQVYNNIDEQDDSTQAVRETYGQIMAYNGEPITTYYYSTSCGHTSDISLWNGNPASCPYLVAKEVTPDGKHTDLSTEEAFEEFINQKNPESYDSTYGFYRWNVNMSLEELTISINENIYSRWCADNNKIKVLRKDNWVSEEIRTIGNLEKIQIQHRTSGGAIESLILYGTEKTVLVQGEYNIRFVLSPRDNPITLQGNDTTTFYILPSAYCLLKKTDVGYEITGGGYGHGIGMSQNAVANMVKSGMTYDDVLLFFFENTEIMNVYDDV